MALPFGVGDKSVACVAPSHENTVAALAFLGIPWLWVGQRRLAWYAFASLASCSVPGSA